jgi:hypothetical protein
VTRSFPAVGDYIVSLRVTDDGSPERSAETTLTVRVTIPPVAPTANAGGPYLFCPTAQPWFLNGTKSVNPDDGSGEPGAPGDVITQYAWDLDGNAIFNDAYGPQPNVTAFFTGKGTGAYLVRLLVTDNTALSFPSSGFGNLSDTDSAQVVVRSATDPACACVSDLTARPKLNKVELRWSPRTGAVAYNVYRGSIAGGPYLRIASVSGPVGFYLDQGLVVGNTYYYVVREASLSGTELCQSNEARVTLTTRTR